jgi:hypothetical protein
MSNCPSHVNFAPVSSIATMATTATTAASRLQNNVDACHDRLRDGGAS